jgi:hypothetical protein
MEINDLIELVQAALNQGHYNKPLDIDDYHILRNQQLSGVVYSAIKHQDHVLIDFKQDYYQYIQRDEVHQQLMGEIRTLFNRHHIDYIFLKGAYLKSIYPQSFMRPMGDIDILVRPDSMNHVHEILDENGYHNWVNSTNHDCFMKHQINVEIHPKLDSDISKDYGNLFYHAWDYAKVYHENEYQLDISYNYFYQIYHMIKHLYHSGVGVRSIIDLYYTSKLMDKNSEEFINIYHQFPQKKFVCFLDQVILQFFTDIQLLESDECGKIKKITIDQFIEYMLMSGTHGIGENHNLFIGGMATKHKNHQWMIWTKFKFLCSKTFLNLQQMKGIYHYLHKFPFLLPFAWVQRMFKLLFNKSSRQKLSRFYINKQDIQTVEDLFKNIGIK